MKCGYCGEELNKKRKFCSKLCRNQKSYIRYQIYVKRGVFRGQCTENVNSNHGIFKCPNKGLKNREGMCDECYTFNLRKHGIYPHKDNATRCTELYLVL
jgi:hypothetical protein